MITRSQLSMDNVASIVLSSVAQQVSVSNGGIARISALIRGAFVADVVSPTLTFDFISLKLPACMMHVRHQRVDQPCSCKPHVAA